MGSNPQRTEAALPCTGFSSRIPINPPPLPYHCHGFFPASSLTLSCVAPLSLQGGACNAAASHKTQRRVRDTALRKVERCIAQTSALKCTAFLFFSGSACCAKKTGRHDFIRHKTLWKQEEKQAERQLNSLEKREATLSAVRRGREGERARGRQGGNNELILGRRGKERRDRQREGEEGM